MKKIPILIVFACSLLIQIMGYAVAPPLQSFPFASVKKRPPETVVLTLPNNEWSNWKEISRDMTEQNWMVERIPLDQTTTNWSELIAMQYFDRSVVEQGRPLTVREILDRLRETILSSYPGSRVTWKILETSKDSAIYEKILHEQHRDTAPQQDVCRVFLTNKGVYTIAFTRKDTEMSSMEREKWIKLLKESVSVVSFDTAVTSPGVLSLVDTSQRSKR